MNILIVIFLIFTLIPQINAIHNCNFQTISIKTDYPFDHPCIISEKLHPNSDGSGLYVILSNKGRIDHVPYIGYDNILLKIKNTKFSKNKLTIISSDNIKNVVITDKNNIYYDMCDIPYDDNIEFIIYIDKKYLSNPITDITYINIWFLHKNKILCSQIINTTKEF